MSDLFEHYIEDETLVVEYEITGSYRRQTQEEPAEYPEVEICSVVNYAGADIIDECSDELMETLAEKAMEILNDQGA